MTNKTVLILLASVLTFGSMSATANDGYRRGFSGHNGWRLGEPVRDGFAIYRQTGRGWRRVPGAGIAIADGWVLGSGRESGGYAIYRWNGRGWDQAPGGAVRIGGSYQQPWVVNDRGQYFVWNGYDWRLDIDSFRGRDDHFERLDPGNEHYRDYRPHPQQPRYRRDDRW